MLQVGRRTGDVKGTGGMRFKNKVLIIGYGSVARCVLPVLLKHVRIPCKSITVLDFVDKREELRTWLAKGVRFSQERINPINIRKVLSKHLAPGGLLIDLSWNIDCLEMLSWCHDNKVLYINTSVEEWDPYANIHKETPFEKSLFYRQMRIRDMVATWSGPATTAILDHGANPGLISHFTKQGLLDIAAKVVGDNAMSKKDCWEIKKWAEARNFAPLAKKLGVKTIHISERDTQITAKPKDVEEFVGTWSIEGLREEGIAPAEMGWGTHEKEVPLFASFPPSGRHQVFLSQMGMNTWVRSWVPYGEIVGMVIRHAEAFSISDHLSVIKNGKVVYCPTVHYAYMPCNETLASMHELRCRNYELQKKLRIMGDEIIKGADILGALIMGHKYNSWWTGSVLSIEESRELVPGQNATTLQVAIGAVAAVMWMLENPEEGLCFPDDLPHDYILNIARPYLGTFLSVPSDWTPLKNYQTFFKEDPSSRLDPKNPWCFGNFLFRD
jgi:homospermidine synthase